MATPFLEDVLQRLQTKRAGPAKKRPERRIVDPQLYEPVEGEDYSFLKTAGVVDLELLQQQEQQNEELPEEELSAASSLPPLKKPRRLTEEISIINDVRELDQPPAATTATEAVDDSEDEWDENVEFNVPTTSEGEGDEQRVVQRRQVVRHTTKPLSLTTQDILSRIPPPPTYTVPTTPFFMNNRQVFVNFIDAYLKERTQGPQETIRTCADLGDKSRDTTLLQHQLVVKEYLSLYTPYRGLLLYHGLGSGKTASSIAVAEGLKSSKQIIVMTPKSLRRNYLEEIKKYGDPLFRQAQHWQKVRTQDNEQIILALSTVLGLSTDWVRSHKSVWLAKPGEKANYHRFRKDATRKKIDAQIDAMIQNKYKFINYNGLRGTNFPDISFDNSVIIVDEAHNLVSAIVNKLKQRGDKNKVVFLRLYEKLLAANDSKVVLLTGTPMINYPNELGVLFNILRGYIKTWRFYLEGKPSEDAVMNIFKRSQSMDFRTLEKENNSSILIVTRNPYEFQNVYEGNAASYRGVKKVPGTVSDEKFKENVIAALRAKKIQVQEVKVSLHTALPDDLEQFVDAFVDLTKDELKSPLKFMRRIVGLTSYFRSTQENLLPLYEKVDDFKVVNVEMSDYQFKQYIDARRSELKTDKNKRARQAATGSNIYTDMDSSYRIFSRMYCNFAFPVPPGRPVPAQFRSEKDALVNRVMRTVKNLRRFNEEQKGKIIADLQQHLTSNDDGEDLQLLVDHYLLSLQDGSNREIGIDKYVQKRGDILKNEPKPILLEVEEPQEEPQEEQQEQEQQQEPENEEQEIEADELLAAKDQSYNAACEEALKVLQLGAADYLTPTGLEMYSPKFLSMLDNIADRRKKGPHLVYSQFRRMEGIAIFAMVLEANGFIRLKLQRSGASWTLDESVTDGGQPRFALYTGTESDEEREIIRNIYNGEWSSVPSSITRVLNPDGKVDNRMGNVIKVLMITAAGSEGISLMNTRYVHLMEPYWHPVRLEQVVGRARRICSHKDLPERDRFVKVFLYLSVFSQAQEKSENQDVMSVLAKDFNTQKQASETTDQYLYQLSERKERIATQFLESIRRTSIDCSLQPGANNCLTFVTNNNTSLMTYQPSMELDKDIEINAILTNVKVKVYTRKEDGKEFAIRIDQPRSDGRSSVFRLEDFKEYVKGIRSSLPREVAAVRARFDSDGKIHFKRSDFQFLP